MKMHACVLALLCLSCALASGSIHAQRNFYDALNVEPTATQSQIKKAFRSLALKYHPDKNKSAEAEERFREITQAYKVLSSSEERKLYDRLGHEAFLKNSSGVRHEEPNFNDIFHFFEGDVFEMDTEFMWTFSNDVVFEQFDFHNHEFSFSDSEEFEEDIYF
ncbi:hypothetical protein NL108_009688 [Boleophthalmus pectinirostris]|uniref:dnaJ homolog subfamily B member 9-like n=1 Tax=Boleophthalmus pectinirostris TaxID=150288 RepID=UPI00242B3DD5|nr:dnaJ homolog subfamily B member 9-like [Boleophthalmus pectinirostris]XP_055016775.1 dnaJ homolog subfamily B member 9-like [Boleophthalmus pectinirostris]KAJ0068579.1 hypothetical protein NL108_009688 [Boleophthalmus pectinirostris]